jgi:hypothetical protein
MIGEVGRGSAEFLFCRQNVPQRFADSYDIGFHILVDELSEQDLAALIDEETARGGGGGDGVTGEDIVKVADPQPCPLYEDEVLSVAESV